ncbi:hypothetical protein ABIB68_008288 [Bradyrhizobium sp. F1.2.2]
MGVVAPSCHGKGRPWTSEQSHRPMSLIVDVTEPDTAGPTPAGFSFTSRALRARGMAKRDGCRPEQELDELGRRRIDRVVCPGHDDRGSHHSDGYQHGSRLRLPPQTRHSISSRVGGQRYDEPDQQRRAKRIPETLNCCHLRWSNLDQPRSRTCKGLALAARPGCECSSASPVTARLSNVDPISQAAIGNHSDHNTSISATRPTHAGMNRSHM